MRVTFDLPRSFDPTECLTGRLAIKADYARWLVSTIVRKMAGHDTDRWGCARFSCDELSHVLGADEGKIIRALQESGVIEGAPPRPGAKRRSFRLSIRFARECHYRRVSCEDPAFAERLQEVGR